MIPNFELFGKVISPYMLCALAGVLVVLFFTDKLAKGQQLDRIHMMYLLLYCFVGVLVGGSILYAITNMELVVYTWNNPGQIDSLSALLERLMLIFGGSVYYGGLMGAVCVCFVYLRRHRLPMGPYADVAALAIPLFHFFGRLGCFLSGCCYGIEWAHGITYRHSPAFGANGVARFPVQLVEAVLNLLLFFVMYRCLRKGRMKNRLLALYFSVYPVYRFLLEYLRGDAVRGFLGPLSTSQVISVLLLLAVSGFWIRSAVKTCPKHTE